MKGIARFYIFWVVIMLCFLSQNIKAQDNEPDEYFNVQKNKKYSKNFSDKQITFLTNKWYLGVETMGKIGQVSLENDLNGLLTATGYGDPMVGAVIGYQHQHQWMAEIGLQKMPFSYGLTLGTSPPYRVSFKANQIAVPLRIKYKVLTIGKVLKMSGLYVGVGFTSLMPQKEENLGGFNVRAITFGGGSRDTVIFRNRTTYFGKYNLLPEASVEMQVYLSKSFDIHIFGRYQTGLSPVILSEMTQTRNGQLQASFQAKDQGTAIVYGFALHYNYSVKKIFDRKE